MSRFAWLSWVWRQGHRLRWRSLAVVVAGALAALGLARAWVALAYPRGDLSGYLEETYGPEHHSDRSPLAVARELQDDRPAEDQRYTGAGVLLRYEHDIVALVPDGRGGTSVEREDPAEGFRYYAYLGDFWWPAYRRSSRARRARWRSRGARTWRRSRRGCARRARSRGSATAGTSRSAAAAGRGASGAPPTPTAAVRT